MWLWPQSSQKPPCLHLPPMASLIWITPGGARNAVSADRVLVLQWGRPLEGVLTGLLAWLLRCADPAAVRRHTCCCSWGHGPLPGHTFKDRWLLRCICVHRQRPPSYSHINTCFYMGCSNLCCQEGGRQHQLRIPSLTWSLMFPGGEEGAEVQPAVDEDFVGRKTFVARARAPKGQACPDCSLQRNSLRTSS